VNAEGLQKAPKALLNMLDKLKVECNSCKKSMSRGEFAHHVSAGCKQTEAAKEKKEEKTNDTTIVITIVQVFVSSLSICYDLLAKKDDTPLRASVTRYSNVYWSSSIQGGSPSRTLKTISRILSEWPRYSISITW